MSRPVFGFVPAAPFIAPALPVAVPTVTGAAVAGVGLAASLPVLVAVGAGLAGGFLLGAGLAQLWGRAAGPKRTEYIGWSELNDQWQSVPSGTLISGTFGAVQTGSGTLCNGSPWSVVQNVTGGTVPSNAITSWRYRITVLSYETGSCSTLNPKFSSLSATMAVEYVRTTGTTGTRLINGWGYNSGGNGTGTWSVTPNLSGLLLNGSPVVAPSVPVEWQGVTQAFEFEPVSSDFASSGFVPVSQALSSFDNAPAGDPLTEQETGNAAAPALPPLIAPTFWPALAPAGRPIANDGNLVPLPPALPATTPTDVHFPVAGGSPVGGLAQSPPATLAGIAAEVGRIEAKLNRLLNPLAPGDSTDLLQLLWQAIQALYNSMADNRPAGEYLLSTPCELDDDGNRIVSSVGYPETSDNTTAVLARIDALAALLQTHKDLKQPICRQTPAVGQPVQVQFVQIE